jgi:hypothetical protein
MPHSLPQAVFGTANVGSLSLGGQVFGEVTPPGKLVPSIEEPIRKIALNRLLDLCIEEDCIRLNLE